MKAITEEKTKVEDNFYRLEEMHDSMRTSLTNIINVMKQQEELIEVVENSDKKDKFEKFIADLKQTNSDLQSQYDRLDKRTACLEKVFAEVEDFPKGREIVNNLLSGLAVFER